MPIRKERKLSMTMAAALAAACLMSTPVTGVAADDAAVASPTPVPSYYIVTRPDLRKCAYPFCGGYFVKAVNQTQTRCADGSWARECHAVELDAKALGWSDEQRRAFDDQFAQGRALVSGNLRVVPRYSVKADVLVLAGGWVGQALSKPTGAFYGVKSSGIVCITFPCPSLTETLLNYGTTQPLAGLDLAASGAGDKQVEAGLHAAATTGILAAGKHRVVKGPGGKGQELVTSEFYLPVIAAKQP